MEVVIKGRTYTVEELAPCGEGLRADLIARGWDGKQYAFTGKRGALSLGFRCAKTGRFDLGTSI